MCNSDYGIQYEKMDVLQEYLNSGTWDVDTSWSKEAAQLRSLAVSEPWKINDDAKGTKFIHHFFKSLRIIDKQVMFKALNLVPMTSAIMKLFKNVFDRSTFARR